MFFEIFSLGEFHNSPNFLPPMCSCNEFAKFSHCQSFPPYSSHYYLVDVIEITQKICHLKMMSNSWCLDLICSAYLQLVDHAINFALARLLNRWELSSVLGKHAVTVVMYGCGIVNHLSRINQLETSCYLQLFCLVAVHQQKFSIF